MKKLSIMLIIAMASFILLTTCKKDEEKKVELPIISTLAVTEVSATTANSGGEITNDGGGEITSKGIVWSTSQNPALEQHTGITVEGVGAGLFQSILTGLTPSTTYYVKAFASNSAGTAYGSQVQFKTELSGSVPEAAFNASSTFGNAPLTVTFTDQSTNNPTSWQWNFGGGNTSTLQNPQHIYQNTGTYTVQLSVTNSHGFDTKIKTNYISVTTDGGTSQPCPDTPTVTDIDGNVYNTVLIGDQCWMAENLNVTRDAAGNYTTRYCYEDNTTNCEQYGGLYTWNTLMKGAGSSNDNPSGVQGICPEGWHVPSDAEWTQLVDYVLTQGYPNNSDDPNGAGNALKSCRKVNSPLGGDCNTTVHPHWYSHGTHHGFDAFGFAALPGGSHFTYGSFSLGAHGIWWSSTETSSTGALYRRMNLNTGHVSGYGNDKGRGFSVRCLRD